MTSRGPKFESYERNIFVYFLCLSFFYLLFCEFDVCLLVKVLLMAEVK